MFKLFMMFILILFSTSGVKAESSLCDKLLGQPDYLKDERVYLVRLCTMKSLSESAITVYLERGHLPVLEEFFPIIPRRSEERRVGKEDRCRGWEGQCEVRCKNGS